MTAPTNAAAAHTGPPAAEPAGRPTGPAVRAEAPTNSARHLRPPAGPAPQLPSPGGRPAVADGAPRPGRRLRLAVPDLVSNSYFPAVAAVTLGYLRDEGLDVDLQLRYPVTDAVDALARGDIDLLAGAAHAPCHAPGRWEQVQLVAALARRVYWFLVVSTPLARAGVHALADLRGCTVAAAPGPDEALRALLRAAGVDPTTRDVRLVPVPAGPDGGTSFGVNAARALADGRVDAFWANGMGARVAVRDGVGTVIYDARRDESGRADFTFPALIAPRALIDAETDTVAAAVRAVVRTQRALTTDPDLATTAAAPLFPPAETALIRDLVARDLPWYRPEITTAMSRQLAAFAAAEGLHTAAGDHTDLVATRFAAAWSHPDDPRKVSPPCASR